MPPIFIIFSVTHDGYGNHFSGAQNSFYLKPSLSFGHEQLQIQDDVYHIPGTSLKIEVLKFYIAHMTVSGECEASLSTVDDYSLIDFSKTQPFENS
ncbi:MAG: hypothetical protein IPN26_09400 [Bacteroidetes bacterium]|nr:hypothetical protein [Bacteroidota bacterium]